MPKKDVGGRPLAVNIVGTFARPGCDGCNYVGMWNQWIYMSLRGPLDGIVYCTDIIHNAPRVNYQSSCDNLHISFFNPRKLLTDSTDYDPYSYGLLLMKKARKK